MEAEQGERVLRRVAWRLMPFMCLLYLLAYLDRGNIGFASLQMNSALGISDTMFGFASGMFFWGYMLFEVPSNLMLERVGARRWIARIMVTWGLIAASMMFVQGHRSLGWMRFLLGAAEAGLFPGMVLYLSYWFPARWRAHMSALFFASSGVAMMVAGPLSGGLLSLDGAWGLAGWQWLFLGEGLPSALVGCFVLLLLTDRPGEAKWLAPEEARWLEEEVGRDSGRGHAAGTLMDAIRHPRVWALTAIQFPLNMGGYASVTWMAKVIKSITGHSDARVGLICGIPFTMAVIAMILVGRHSDRTGERRWHAGLSLTVAAIGLACAPFCGTLPTALLAFTLAVSGIWCALGPFWSLPGEFLRGTAAAAGIAIINSVGNLGGFVGPYIVGYVRDRYNGFNGGLIVVAACVLAGAVGIVVGLRDRSHGPQTRGFETIPEKR